MKNVKWIIRLLLVFAVTAISAQENVGIGTVQPHQATILEVSAVDRGVLLPRINLNADTVLAGGANPIGVLIFNTGEGAIPQKGFYFWTGNNWELLALDTEVGVEIEKLEQKIQQLQQAKQSIGTPPVPTNQIIDNKIVFIGRFDIEVAKPEGTDLSYNTTSKEPLLLANFDKVLDAKIYDPTGELVLQTISDISNEGGLSFYFGIKHMYTALPIGNYQLILTYVSTLVAN